MFDVANLPRSFFVNGQIGYKFGKSSFLILNSVYYKYTLEDKYAKNIEIILSDIIFHIEEKKIAVREFEELTDFYRVLIFLDQIEVLDLCDYDFLINKITQRLEVLFCEQLKENDFHFCRGILVFGNFFLEAHQKVNDFTKELKLIVEWIKQHSYLQGNGCYWINANPNFKGKVYLSSLYGNLSVCKFLLEVSRLGIKEADIILKAAIHFVMQQLRSGGKGLKIFVDPIDGDGLDSSIPILQWVEGGFDILFSLVVFFKEYLEESDYNIIFNNLLLVSKLKENEVDCIKSSITYGSTGVWLMFEKLYRTTKHSFFEQAASYWRSVTIERNTARIVADYPDSVRLTGFLPGYTGVYTALKLYEQNEIFLLDKLIYI